MNQNVGVVKLVLSQNIFNGLLVQVGECLRAVKFDTSEFSGSYVD